jgi:lipopolysaccharide export LptBFGC system permease protein LptF
MQQGEPWQKATPQDRSKPFITWGWILATVGSLIIPFLALLATVFGVLVITRSNGNRTGTGVGIIVVSIFVGLFAFGFWSGLA